MDRVLQYYQHPLEEDRPDLYFREMLWCLQYWHMTLNYTAVNFSEMVERDWAGDGAARVTRPDYRFAQVFFDITQALNRFMNSGQVRQLRDLEQEYGRYRLLHPKADCREVHWRKVINWDGEAKRFTMDAHNHRGRQYVYPEWLNPNMAHLFGAVDETKNVDMLKEYETRRLAQDMNIDEDDEEHLAREEARNMAIAVERSFTEVRQEQKQQEPSQQQRREPLAQNVNRNEQQQRPLPPVNHPHQVVKFKSGMEPALDESVPIEDRSHHCAICQKPFVSVVAHSDQDVDEIFPQSFNAQYAWLYRPMFMSRCIQLYLPRRQAMSGGGRDHCDHIYHYQCIQGMYMMRNTQECPQCRRQFKWPSNLRQEMRNARQNYQYGASVVNGLAAAGIPDHPLPDRWINTCADMHLFMHCLHKQADREDLMSFKDVVRFKEITEDDKVQGVLTLRNAAKATSYESAIGQYKIYACLHNICFYTKASNWDAEAARRSYQQRAVHGDVDPQQREEEHKQDLADPAEEEKDDEKHTIDEERKEAGSGSGMVQQLLSDALQRQGQRQSAEQIHSASEAASQAVRMVQSGGLGMDGLASCISALVEESVTTPSGPSLFVYAATPPPPPPTTQPPYVVDAKVAEDPPLPPERQYTAETAATAIPDRDEMFMNAIRDGDDWSVARDRHVDQIRPTVEERFPDQYRRDHLFRMIRSNRRNVRRDRNQARSPYENFIHCMMPLSMAPTPFQNLVDADPGRWWDFAQTYEIDVRCSSDFYRNTNARVYGLRGIEIPPSRIIRDPDVSFRRMFLPRIQHHRQDDGVAPAQPQRVQVTWVWYSANQPYEWLRLTNNHDNVEMTQWRAAGRPPFVRWQRMRHLYVWYDNHNRIHPKWPKREQVQAILRQLDEEETGSQHDGQNRGRDGARPYVSYRQDRGSGAGQRNRGGGRGFGGDRYRESGRRNDGQR